MSGPETAHRRPVLVPAPRDPGDDPRGDSRDEWSDQARRPLLDALRAHLRAGTVPFSCPGHKGAGADPDLVELIGQDAFTADTWLGAGGYAAALAEAESLAAAAWSADRAWLLTAGSSSGNHALLLAALAPGREVVLGRDAHTSTHAGLVMTGARPVWVAPRMHPSYGVALGMDPGDLARALDEHPEAALALVVSPGYHGTCSDIRALATVAHDRGVPLAVDQAWGPHLAFGAGLPPDALASGADIAVTSSHKMLTSLSQAALLLARGDRIPAERIARAVAMVRTTSPYLPLVASIDAARAQAALHGGELLDRAAALADVARRRLGNIPGVRVLGAAELGLPPERCDPLRLVLDVRGTGVSGLVLERMLRAEHAIAPEGADLHRLVLVVGIGDSLGSVEAMVAAFAARADAATRSGLLRPPTAAGQAPPYAVPTGAPSAPMTPAEAFFARAESVPLADAAGRVCAETVTPYPPGIPALLPGEVAEAAVLEGLAAAAAAGVHLHGCNDPTLGSLLVVGSRGPTSGMMGA